MGGVSQRKRAKYHLQSDEAILVIDRDTEKEQGYELIRLIFPEAVGDFNITKAMVEEHLLAEGKDQARAQFTTLDKAGPLAVVLPPPRTSTTPNSSEKSGPSNYNTSNSGPMHAKNAPSDLLNEVMILFID